MALDGIFLSLVKKELSVLLGGRVEKVYQPSREELTLSIRTSDGHYKLLMNAAAGTARVHITNAEIENPKTPPMFCLALRKRLCGGRVADIRQDGYERILYFDLDCTDELGDPHRLTLAAEIMGRRSNIILIGDDGKIVDAIKRVTPEMSSVRAVLPGMTYTVPPRLERLDLFELDENELYAALKAYGNKKLSNALVQAIEGISPVFAAEAMWQAQTDDKPSAQLTQNECARLAQFFAAEAQKLKNNDCNYTMLLTPEGQFKDFCFTQINHYGSLMQVRSADGACELLDEFFTERTRLDRVRQRAGDLMGVLERLTERTARRLENQRLELKECADREQIKLRGDLIMTNLYSLKKGDTELLCDNFYSDEQEKIQIALDPRLTPVQNAQKYYKDYRRADTAEKKLTELVKYGESELEYLESVLDALTRAENDSDISQLREELAEQGYIRRRSAKGSAAKALPPMKFVTDDGYTVLVGRHNRQNDRLTLKDAKKTDIWLHTQNITGSHTVIITNDSIPPISTIEQAARIAAYHSKARQSSRVPVDYTFIKCVKKPNGAKPGMVIFTDQKTLYVTPDPSEIERLKYKN